MDCVGSYYKTFEHDGSGKRSISVLNRRTFNVKRSKADVFNRDSVLRFATLRFQEKHIDWIALIQNEITEQSDKVKSIMKKYEFKPILDYRDRNTIPQTMTAMPTVAAAGGSIDEMYYRKYLKYKQKYLQEKKNLHK